MATAPTLAACSGTWGTTPTGAVTCTGEIQPVNNVPLSVLTFEQADQLLAAALVPLCVAAGIRLLIAQIRNR